MIASELNTELNKLVTRAVNEGILTNKIPFEQVVGIIESHKINLVGWRQAQLAALAAAEQAKATIVMPNGRPILPQ